MSVLRFRKLQALLLAGCAVLLLVGTACGETAAPDSGSGQQAQPSATEQPAASNPTPTFTPMPTRVLDATPTSVPVPTPVPADARPDWWQGRETKHYRGTFPMVGQQQPRVLGRALRRFAQHHADAFSPRFNQLVEYNPVKPSEIIGDLAETWEVSDDGTEYVFHLKDATWSDGMPVTAEDVVFSLDRITLPGAQRARTGFLRAFYVHQTAEVVDAKTVRVPLKYQAPTFMPNLASDYMKMYPKHIAEDLTQEEANSLRT